MKHCWTPAELEEYFSLFPDERVLINEKDEKNRLGFAVLLKFFQKESRFPERQYDVPQAIIHFLANQLELPAVLYAEYEWSSRPYKNHRAEIRSYFSFKEATEQDLADLKEWLLQEIVIHDHKTERIKSEVYQRLATLRVEPPKTKQLDRLIRSVIRAYEKHLFQHIFDALPAASCNQIDELLKNEGITIEKETLTLEELKGFPGQASLATFFQELKKLQFLRCIELPDSFVKSISPKIQKRYYQRVVSEKLQELRVHPDYIRYSLLTIYLWQRRREVTDNTVEIIIQLVHNMETRAEFKVEKEFIREIKRVSGKNNILFRIADVAVAKPDGIIKQTIYPEVGEQTLKALVEEYRQGGSSYQAKVHQKARQSYTGHYRSMVPTLLKHLSFHSNNETFKPVIEALEVMKKYSDSKIQYYPPDEEIPIKDVIPNNLRDIVIEKDKEGREKVNRINFELTAINTLREKIRCKEVWVEGADRFRNPDEDLPTDFEQNRVHYYQTLNHPLDVEAFIASLKSSMQKALTAFDKNIFHNSKVRISKKGKKKSWIFVTPLEAQNTPQNLSDVKKELSRRWPMTSLLDILKETDLRLSFSQHFKSVADREILERSTIQKRLLLCLYGLGTNTGIKRMGLSGSGENYKDLLYIRRKFINRDNLRNAITAVTNSILASRHQAIWGEGTTSCASDSKKFGAWDQNLMTEWHIRYHGRGIMVYWHVEKKSACIYSQLKTCSSSEVAAMIEGLLRHCTEMEVEQNYTDSHGQSEIAFAFCHLLGFKLMPRIKQIGRKKLYRPDIGMKEAFPNLQRILTRPIDWELIRNQYDQMIKYATAIRLGTAETDSILRRFTRENVQHPTYKALAELGRAVETIFLCEYLGSEAVRREIQEGLNIIENWNSANGFIFYGKGGEISTNRLDDQEIAILSLHLLQNCLIYINTLMFQEVLSEPKWFELMTSEDFRAITPLIYNHVNPYGEFKLDLAERLPIERQHIHDLQKNLT